ncbi:MAG: hypothetical protein DRP64_04095 [Verrucomicrobia bacterium]|nr:MAG: hypothetical protein DRP64_04095 [Verrucomicrobiota bacterium]
MDDEEKLILNVFVQTVVLHSLLRGINPVQVITDTGIDEPTMQAIKKSKEIAEYIVQSNFNAS